MKIIKIIIEKNEDGFWAYSKNEKGITGGGDTVEACKQDIMDCIDTMKTFDDKNRPDFLNEAYRVTYNFDTESLLQYYKGIFTQSALERMTGINQRQLSHYANGLKKPRRPQVEKIENALHRLGEELLAIEL